MFSKRASLCATNQGYSRMFFCIAVIPILSAVITISDFWGCPTPSIHEYCTNSMKPSCNYFLMFSVCCRLLQTVWLTNLALDRIYHALSSFFLCSKSHVWVTVSPHVWEKIPPFSPPFLPTILPIIFAHHVCLCEKYLCPSPHWPSLPKRQETLHDSDLFLWGGGLQES